jgi:DNA polymerase III delta' subunit
MVADGPPHALVLAGPARTGKTTLALDLAAGLLCQAADPAERPCRRCRACRMVADRVHPDLHRLAPGGAGYVIGIDRIRELISQLSLLSAEGGERLAIIEQADRMTEDAQHALLKMLEEPPARVTIVLCVDDEEQLLSTVRSRSARLRLGPLATGEIEQLLVDRGEADAPTAARLARLVQGRPGRAIALAGAPEAVTARGEITRSLLDLLEAGPADRLLAIRDLAGQASRLAVAFDPRPAEPRSDARRRTTRRAAPGGQAVAAPDPAAEGDPAAAEDSGASGLTAAAERRRNTAALLETWHDLARDLILVGLGSPGRVRDVDLIEELERTAGRLDRAAVIDFLVRLERAWDLLGGNANPELLADVLVLAWPAPRRAA